MKLNPTALLWCGVAVMGSVLASATAKLANPHISLFLFALIANTINVLANALFFHAFPSPGQAKLGVEVKSIARAALPLSLMLAVTIFCNDLNWFQMLKHGQISQAVPFHAVAAVIGAVAIALLFFKEHMTPRKALGIGLGLAGIGLLHAG